MPQIDSWILDEYKGTDPSDFTSDTYLFVDGELIIHNKSSFLYNDEVFANQGYK